MGGITQRAAAALPGLTAFAILTAVASDQGGYFRSTWGWTGIALAWVGLVTLILRQRIGLSRAMGALFAVAAGVVSWTFLSALWADDGSIAVREGERAALYLVAVIVVALISRPGGALQWAGGSLAAASAVAAYALARAALFTGARRPDPYEGFHLSRPLGYANALGIFCALGLVAAVGVVAERTGGGRGAAAGAAAVFLAAALSLTSSRGAWIALAVALAVLVTVSADRINVLASGVALAPAAGAAVTACLLTRLQRTQPPLATATEGRALAAGIVMLGVLGAVIVPRAQPALARRIARIAGRLPPPMVRALPVMVAVGAALAVAVAYVLIATGASTRAAYWSAAAREIGAHPVLGGGAGSFARFWAARASGVGPVQDAHSLYVETLAELGPAGLALVVALLVVPAVLLVRARVGWRRPAAVPAAAVAIVAGYAVHAGLDWDWEMPAVTLVPVIVATGVLAAELRPGDARDLGSGARLVVAAVLVGLAAVTALEFLGSGN